MRVIVLAIFFGGGRDRKLFGGGARSHVFFGGGQSDTARDVFFGGGAILSTRAKIYGQPRKAVFLLFLFVFLLDSTHGPKPVDNPEKLSFWLASVLPGSKCRVVNVVFLAPPVLRLKDAASLALECKALLRLC